MRYDVTMMPTDHYSRAGLGWVGRVPRVGYAARSVGHEMTGRD